MLLIRSFALTVVALLVLVATAGSALAQTSQQDVVWQRYDVDITVQTDGSLAIAETQAIAFRGTLQHGLRVIPLDRTSGITNVSVAEQTSTGEQAYSPGSNRPGTFANDRATDGLAIDWWFQPATNTTRTFVVRYVAHDAVRQYADGDQVQWKAVYADRAGPVQSGTVTVHLPGDVPSSMPSALYLFDARGGPEREVGPARQLDSRTMQLMLAALPNGTGGEVRVQFPHGLLTANPPAWQADADRADWVQQSLGPIATFLSLLLTLAIVVGGGVGLFMLWYSRGREPSVGPTPGVLEQPPSDLRAPLVGTLVDGTADVQDGVAALVDLGEQGVLTLHDEPGPPPDVRVTLHRSTDDSSLRPYERTLLSALFGRGASSGEILLSAARLPFAAAVPALEQQLYAAVAQEGLFVENPQRVRQRYLAIGAVVLVAGIGLAILASALVGWAVGAVWLPGLSLAVVGGGLMLLATVMPRRTPRGALEAARWSAFRAHLAAERQHGSVDPHHLAYAVAFGLDRNFLRQLEQHGAPPPGWYGSGPVVILPGGGYGYGGAWRHGRAGGGTAGPPLGTPPVAPSPQGWSDALAGLLTVASEAMAHGGGSGHWSGGGWGGGGGGGGGRGGFN